MSRVSVRSGFIERVAGRRQELTELCAKLVRTGSENPPGDTGPLVDVVGEALRGVAGVTTERVIAKEPCVNLVARLEGGRPGRRLVFNSHLDTFPVGDASRWTHPPLGGAISDGRIYGRGVSDMKAGLAAAMMAMTTLSEVRDHLSGELVLACVADEETGGRWGTEYLLNNLPHTRGDAMLSGDAGSPKVLRFGEKGLVWMELVAHGVSSHGAHVHRGVNAIEKLMTAIGRILALREREVAIPPSVLAAMKEAQPVSEPLSGEGEFATLQRVTVNVGAIGGGSVVNIIPDRASAQLDVRFPPGATAAEVLAWVDEAISAVPGVERKVDQACDPTVTDPGHELATLALANARGLLGPGVVANMRIGMSDARLYREMGIPTVVYGPTPHNMGGVDEHVTVDDLFAVYHVHALTAFDYLSR